MDKIPYPATLTDKDWQKKKGLLAKVKIGETGMGAKLSPAEKKYAEIKWEHFMVKPVYGNVKAVDIAEEMATLHFRQVVQPLINLVRAASGHAKELGEDLKSKKAPAGTLEALQAIVKDADLFVLKLKNIGDLSKEFEKARQTAGEGHKETMENLLGPGLKTAREVLDVVHTSGAMSSVQWNRLRTVGAIVGKSDSLKPVQPEWKSLSSVSPDKLASPTAVKEHAGKFLELLGRTDQLVK